MAAVDLNAISAILVEPEAKAPVKLPPAKRELKPRPEVSPAQTERKAAEVDPLDALEALAGGSETVTPDAAPQTADVTPSTLKALAEKLGVEAADLYALTIPLGGDGESMTLGQLKDLAKESKDLDVQRAVHEEAVESARVTQRRDREELELLVAMIPPAMLTPSMIDKARSAGEKYQTEQAALLAELVPEWRDTAAYTADRAEMLAHVEKSGWSKEDLDSLHDARLLAYFRRQAKREARMAAILSRLTAATTGGRGFKANAGQVQRAEQARRQGAARDGSRSQKITEIESILKG
jgi:hypothetical protein